MALEVTTADLAAAARDWDRERRAFPGVVVAGVQLSLLAGHCLWPWWLAGC